MDKQEYRKNMMMTEPISRIIPKMAIPTIVAFLINSIYSLADTYFVSSLGTNATAAVSVNSSLDQIIMMAGSMLALGANSFIARLLGAKDEKKAARVLSTAFFIAAAFGSVIMVLTSYSWSRWFDCWVQQPPANNMPLSMQPMCCWWHRSWPPVSS